MSELERARAHLTWCQWQLSRWRGLQTIVPEIYLGNYESAVLAALSWVWEEQENERYRGYENMCPCEAEIAILERR